MKESVAIAKEANSKKESSPTRSDNSIQRLRDEPERQLGSLRAVIGNIRRDGGKPSVESIATELSVMPSSDRASALLALQQTHGNQYVQRVVTGIQAKLKVGQLGDKYEQEADRVAEQVMQMPELKVQRQPEEEDEEEELIQTKTLADQITPLVQRQVDAEEEEEEEEILQTKVNPGQTPEVTSDLEYRINALRGGGQPLPGADRSFMERRFGVDFSDVRIHTDSNAVQMSRELNSQAFMQGRNIYFGTGRYNPGTSSGKRLLAHELAHVVQQRAQGLAAPAVQCAETDTRGLCSGLADGSNALNSFVNTQIQAARTGVVLPSGSQTLLQPVTLVGGTYRGLGALSALSHLPIVAAWANNHLPSRSFGTGGYGTGRGSKYEHAQGGYLLYLAPAVNLNGNCVGTDKIDHMFHVGYRYFQIFMQLSSTYSSSMGQAAARRMGERYARAWGEWSEGVLSPGIQQDPSLMSWLRRMSTPQGAYGITATGVHSRADLAANEAGMRFYRELLASPTMTFDIRRYVSADWDEERIGNIYRRDIGEAVRQAGRLTTADVVLPP